MNPAGGRISSLVLTGNGAYSAYEVGVIGALIAGHSPATRYVPLDPELLIGTGSAPSTRLFSLARVRHGSLLGGIEALPMSGSSNSPPAPAIAATVCSGSVDCHCAEPRAVVPEKGNAPVRSPSSPTTLVLSSTAHGGRSRML